MLTYKKGNRILIQISWACGKRWKKAKPVCETAAFPCIKTTGAQSFSICTHEEAASLSVWRQEDALTFLGLGLILTMHLNESCQKDYGLLCCQGGSWSKNTFSFVNDSLCRPSDANIWALCWVQVSSFVLSACRGGKTNTLPTLTASLRAWHKGALVVQRQLKITQVNRQETRHEWGCLSEGRSISETFVPWNAKVNFLFGTIGRGEVGNCTRTIPWHAFAL